MKYVESPASDMPRGLSLFLAGGITGCPNWQAEVVRLLDSVPGTVFNPRRATFPIHDHYAAYEQIRWEYERLRRVSVVSFWFCAETLCPIVLYELGAALERQQTIVVGLDPSYARRQDVEIQTGLRRPNTPVWVNWEQWIAALNAALREQDVLHAASECLIANPPGHNCARRE